jgi:SAM-dependent methyltransferase
MEPARSFASVVDEYDSARPGYPDEAVRWLVGDTPVDVVDLGAGTGKLTRSLSGLGHRVVAVEPLPAMLERLRRHVPAALPVVGSAESIPLADASADAVVVAQAFHWFDPPRALVEIARVLRPGGTLGLVWNTRDERVGWVRRLSAVIGSESLERRQLEVAFAASGLFGALEARTFRHEQRLTREALLGLVESRSYCATRPADERERVLASVGALFDEEAAGGEVVLPYVTSAYRAWRA